MPIKGARFFSKEILEKVSPNITCHFYVQSNRLRSFLNIKFYRILLRNVVSGDPDIIYINYQGYPYLAIVTKLLLNSRNVIWAVHQATPHLGMKHSLLVKLYFDFLYTKFCNYQLFSATQEEVFKTLYPNRKVTLIPLALKDFGMTTCNPPADKIVFMNFGKIIKNKNIGLLIQAACILYDEGYQNFKVKICGACDNWNYYQKMIRYPEIFDLHISMIDNKEIPNLFGEAHYFILPYSAISQSGQLKIAFNYNVPIIASDLDEFVKEIIDNKTGYLFENNNVYSLVDVMRKAIELHCDNYENLRGEQKQRAEKYNKENIACLYRKLFDSI